jgi:hypothetical protein
MVQNWTKTEGKGSQEPSYSLGEYMDSQEIAKEVEKTLIRYRAGMISLEQSKQELTMLVVMLKAYETTILEAKLDRIEAALEVRR